MIYSYFVIKWKTNEKILYLFIFDHTKPMMTQYNLYFLAVWIVIMQLMSLITRGCLVTPKMKPSHTIHRLLNYKAILVNFNFFSFSINHGRNCISLSKSLKIYYEFLVIVHIPIKKYGKYISAIFYKHLNFKSWKNVSKSF